MTTTTTTMADEMNSGIDVATVGIIAGVILCVLLMANAGVFAYACWIKRRRTAAPSVEAPSIYGPVDLPPSVEAPSQSSIDDPVDIPSSNYSNIPPIEHSSNTYDFLTPVEAMQK